MWIYTVGCVTSVDLAVRHKVRRQGTPCLLYKLPDSHRAPPTHKHLPQHPHPHTNAQHPQIHTRTCLHSIHDYYVTSGHISSRDKTHHHVSWRECTPSTRTRDVAVSGVRRVESAQLCLLSASCPSLVTVPVSLSRVSCQFRDRHTSRPAPYRNNGDVVQRT